MKAAPHILVVGSANIDLVNRVDRIPRAGETLTGLGFAQSFGGKGANQAAMAALAGARVTLVARIGDDAFGERWGPYLAGFGIDTSHVTVTENCASGTASIWVEATGENRIVLAPGANARLSADDVSRALGASARPDIILAQLETPQEATERAFWHARDSLVTTILNPAPAAPINDTLIALTDFLVPNESELRALAMLKGITADNDIALVTAYGKATKARLVVTLGERGAAYFSPRDMSEPVVIAAPNVDVVDTTGAGDAFVGAFAVMIARGEDAARAIGRAVAVASHSVTRRGTTDSYPRGEALAAILKT